MKLYSSLFAAVVAAAIATQANANTLNVNLQPEGGDSTNHLFVTAGQVVTIDVHVVVTSTTATVAGSEGAQLLSGNFRSSNGGLLGNLFPGGDPVGAGTGFGVNGFNGNGSAGSATATTADADADTDFDMGKSTGGVGVVYAARNNALITNSSVGSSVDILLGKITFTVGNGAAKGDTTNIIFDLTGGAFNGRAENAAYTVTTASNFASLSVTPAVLAVQDVPEPASLGALAVGGLALLARRRRNK